MGKELGDTRQAGTSWVIGKSCNFKPQTTVTTSTEEKSELGLSRLVLGRLALIVLAMVCLATLAKADDDDYDRNGGSQTDVARVSLIHGDVSMQRGDSGDWAAATINTPLVRGDQVATGERSRTEVQLDYANTLRLSSGSQAKIADLTRTRIQIQLAQGYANYTMFKGSEADVEIDTPNVAVRPLRAGRYRVQVNSDYETDVIVRDGEVEISTPEGSARVKEGHMAFIRGADNPEYKVEDAPGKDEWDRWNKDRDNSIREARSYRRANSYYTGVQDLDGYGRWVYVPGYGWVWQPYDQPATWAPYQSGRWVWEPYWGWTWVSYEPWGWAPYHYGRWFFWGSSWVWWPGPVYAHYRPVWSPAFVTFIGFGHNAGFALGIGSIGWIPCGPHDYYYPWYGRGFNRVNVVNITNVTNVTNVNYVVRPLAVRGRQPYYSNVDMALKNPRVRGAISGVDAEEFGRGDMRVRRLDVRDNDLRDSRVMTGNLPVVPTRDSLRPGSDRPVRMNTQPRQAGRFYTRHQPPAGPPSFNDQVSRMQQVVGAHTQPTPVPMTQPRGTDGQAVKPSGIYRIPPGGQGTQPGAVNRTDTPERRGNAEVPMRGGAQVPAQAGDSGAQKPSGIYRMPPNTEQPREGDRGGWRSFGGNRPGTGNQPGNSGATGATTMTRPGNVEVPGQGNSGSSAAAGPAENRDRGGWNRFPSANGNGRRDTGSGRSADSAPYNRGNSDRGGSRIDRGGASDGGDSRFPSSSRRAPQQPDRGVQPAPENRSGDGGGWQRFPSNTDRSPRNDVPIRGGDRTDAGSRPVSKPRLDLDKPIVTPRSTPAVHTEPRREASPSYRNEPRYSPPPSRAPEMRGGGAPRNNGGGNRGGDRGGDKGSKGSNPKNR